MDLRTDSLFAGVAGVETELEEFALGQGVVLRKTYAHFMAPFLMAFAPAKQGRPHPAPWSAVRGGLGVEIHVRILHVPAEFEIPRFFDRLNTIWWITALIRLRGASAAHVPVVSDRSFSNHSSELGGRRPRSRWRFCRDAFSLNRHWSGCLNLTLNG